MSCCCDADPAVVWRQETRRARKHHRCTECRGRSIRPGDRYVRIAALADGSWTDYVVCLRCFELTDALQEDCELTCFGMMDELLQDIDIVKDEPELFGHAAGLSFRWSERRYERWHHKLSEMRAS